MARPAARPATSGATRAGSTIFDTTTEKFTPATPAPMSTAPIRPPNRACDELDGSPNSQVSRFHRMAPTRPAKIIVGVTRASSTIPPEMVLATSVDRNAPTTFRIAAISTATFGLQRAGRHRRGHRIGAVVEAVGEVEEQRGHDDHRDQEQRC